MPIKPDHRAQMLQFFAKECSVEDLKSIRSDIEHELSRRISQLLVRLTPGDRIRFLLPASHNLIKGTPAAEEIGTLIRIHRRSMVVELMNREEISVSGDRFIETVPEQVYQDVRNRRRLSGEADTSHVQPAVEALHAARERTTAERPLLSEEDLARLAGSEEIEPPLDPRSVQVPDSMV